MLMDADMDVEFGHASPALHTTDEDPQSTAQRSAAKPNQAKPTKPTGKNEDFKDKNRKHANTVTCRMNVGWAVREWAG
ncbi:hypothetical protein N7481_007257 [Penicillium waksmanii]|uniref:uncharacterized protein n=1 Tax=Penicillium waksmanii TaxID=69791 RepID=UPI002547F7AD|nr:uncharacterized protein N7481_007257 [Penicillium waksmanii]KAJ5979959.1 hypothetical protein N7481_007257 [Penicillium waksmanii]